MPVRSTVHPCTSVAILDESGLQTQDARDEEREKQSLQKELQCLKPGMEKSDVVGEIKKLQKVRSNKAVQQWTDTSDRSFAVYDLNRQLQLCVEYTNPGDTWVTHGKIKSWEIIRFSDLKGETEGSIPHLQWVHESPSIRGCEFDPAALIRAVNNLRHIGKEGALRVLRSYYDLAKKDPLRQHRYGLDEKKILLILRLLFVPKDPRTIVPDFGIGRPDVLLLDRDSHGLFPLTLQEDVPFLLINGYTLSGKGRDPISYWEFCNENCDLRQKPLTPRGSPLSAANALVVSEVWKNLTFERNFEDWQRGMIRIQALRAASAGYFVSGDDLVYVLPNTIVNADEEWKKHWEATRGVNLEWSDRTQLFEMQGVHKPDRK